jgi:hypothetical protein
VISRVAHLRKVAKWDKTFVDELSEVDENNA